MAFGLVFNKVHCILYRQSAGKVKGYWEKFGDFPLENWPDCFTGSDGEGEAPEGRAENFCHPEKFCAFYLGKMCYNDIRQAERPAASLPARRRGPARSRQYKRR